MKFKLLHKRTDGAFTNWFLNLWEYSGYSWSERDIIIKEYNARFILNRDEEITSLSFKHEEDMIRFLMEYS